MFGRENIIAVEICFHFILSIANSRSWVDADLSHTSSKCSEQVQAFSNILSPAVGQQVVRIWFSNAYRMKAAGSVSNTRYGQEKRSWQDDRYSSDNSPMDLLRGTCHHKFVHIYFELCKWDSPSQLEGAQAKLSFLLRSRLL